MLSTNILLMKTKLNSLLTPTSGNPMYDAAYNAYYNANKSTFNVVSVDEDPSGVANKNATETNERIKSCAKEFAEEFCKGLKSSGFMDSIADEIDKHIKSMGLSITVPALLPTIISPMGPCTGSLTISEMTGAQILIN